MYSDPSIENEKKKNHDEATQLQKMKNLDAAEKKGCRHLHYCFVITNYTEQCWEIICTQMEEGKSKFIFDIIVEII